MTNKEAIEMFRAGLETTECKKKKELYNMAIEALEKQIPKKPVMDRYSHIKRNCPNCGVNVIVDYRFPHYCFNCGQVLTRAEE